MAFTINQTPTQDGAPQMTQPVQQQVATQANPGQTAQPLTPTNNSPVLFVRYAGQPLPVSAYIQVVLMLIAAISVAVAIILFAYSYYLKESAASKKEEITQLDATFKTYPIKEMQNFSARSASMQKLLNGYVSVRSPLKLLESVVEKQVYFNNFTFSKKDREGYVMNFSVNTTNYRNLIQQLDALGLPQYSKVAPSVKVNTNSKAEAKTNMITVNVTSPVFVAGVLPDQVVFLDQMQSSNSTQNIEQAVASTSSPQ